MQQNIKGENKKKKISKSQGKKINRERRRQEAKITYCYFYDRGKAINLNKN